MLALLTVLLPVVLAWALMGSAVHSRIMVSSSAKPRLILFIFLHLFAPKNGVIPTRIIPYFLLSSQCAFGVDKQKTGTGISGASLCAV